MATLAPLLDAFFTDHLMAQRQASPNTIAAYPDTFRLLLVCTRDRAGKAPNTIEVSDWDVGLIGAFLQHLETDRANSVTTRNSRLAAIHSLFGFAAYRLPEHAELIQRVLAMRPKRFDQPMSVFSSPPRSPLWWPRPTNQPGPAAATTPCFRSPPRPSCGCRN